LINKERILEFLKIKNEKSGKFKLKFYEGSMDEFIEAKIKLANFCLLGQYTKPEMGRRHAPPTFLTFEVPPFVQSSTHINLS
jgi:hypothetical protein